MHTGEARIGYSTAALARSARSSLQLQRSALQALLVLTDALALAAAFRAAYSVRFELQITVAHEVVPDPSYYPALSAVLIPLWLLLFAATRLYDPRAKLGGLVESSRTFHACTFGAMLVVFGTFFVPSFVVSRFWLICVWIFTFVLVAANRFAVRRLVYALRRRGYLLTPAVIVGGNEEAMSLLAFLGDSPTTGVRPLGVVVPGADSACPPGTAVVGGLPDIEAIVREHEVEDVIVAITALGREELLQLCETLDTLPVQLRLSSGLYELLTTRVTVQSLGNVPVMSLQKNRLSRGEAIVKAVLDRVLAILGLLVLSPLLAAAAIAVRLDSAGPILHRRRVLGVANRQFDAFKFRTMHVDGDERLQRVPGAAEALRCHHKLKDDPRITRVGRWLRRYSIDELPQLANVLIGQMSLAGPRMIAPEEAAKYGRHRMNLLSVKPGITGLWQVSGRSDLNYDERVRLDMYYVRNYSVWLDLQILFIHTLPAVLRGRGAY